MNKLSEKGLIHIILLIILLIAGLMAGLYLIQHPQIFKSKASVTSANLNPNTGNLYSDIKVRLKEVLK